ncbi:transcription initiation factor TFIID subunit 4-like isoform X2 [Brevipalpus obovatus]|uniref:transcription initiation factor TFIID subunit 4-like isoform X2 n=1 Tax=Brevipalpus obovatus TaxID=246614 RepID=UPI003D9DE37E
MSTDGVRPPQPTAQLPPGQRSTLTQVQIPGRNNNVRVIPAGNMMNLPATIFGGNKILLQLQPTNMPTTTGQFRVAVPVSAAVPNVSSGATIAVRTAPPLSTHLQATSTVISSRNGQSVHPITQPITIQTSSANTQATSAQSSQMSPNTAKTKCKNFLATLVKLASEQPENTSRAVKGLIQHLIDGTIQPEDFTNQLQSELHSAPQPCLVPFLKKSLPYLRHSLSMREMTIEGIKPPPIESVQLPHQHPYQQNTTQILQLPSGTRNNVRLINTVMPNNQTIRLAPTYITNPVNIRSPMSFSASTPSGTTITAVTPAQMSNKLHQLSSSSSSTTTATPVIVRTKSTTAKSRAIILTRPEKPDKKNFATTLKDDDDINDVAAMGGVNLVEESQRILATNAEFVGAQIRSCKDENFLFTNPLQNRLNEIAKKHGLDEVSSDVVSLVSHAAQERLKTLVEKLGVIAEHRMENFRGDQRYEMSQDVRTQTKFLEELDRLEKKRHEEQEREMLLRAAKSRSKMEDPEQLKLKQKAKEMQRAELEEARQREANETALLAIGPRKKLKTFNNSSDSGLNNIFSNSSNNTQLSLFSNIKRVNFRDLQFLMEQESEMVRSKMLYKAYVK